MEILERNELSSVQREELAEALCDKSAEELRALLLWMSERHPAAARLASLVVHDHSGSEQLTPVLDDDLFAVCTRRC